MVIDFFAHRNLPIVLDVFGAIRYISLGPTNERCLMMSGGGFLNEKGVAAPRGDGSIDRDHDVAWAPFI